MALETNSALARADPGFREARKYWILASDGNMNIGIQDGEERIPVISLEIDSNRLTHLLEELNQVYFIVDFEWRFTLANQRFYRIAGLDRAKLKGKSLWEVWPGLCRWSGFC